MAACITLNTTTSRLRNTSRKNSCISQQQVLANLALVITEEESPAIRDWLTWRDIFHFVDILCCCAILFPIVWSIKQVCVGACGCFGGRCRGGRGSEGVSVVLCVDLLRRSCKLAV